MEVVPRLGEVETLAVSGQPSVLKYKSVLNSCDFLERQSAKISAYKILLWAICVLSLLGRAWPFRISEEGVNGVRYTWSVGLTSQSTCSIALLKKMVQLAVNNPV